MKIYYTRRIPCSVQPVVRTLRIIFPCIWPVFPVLLWTVLPFTVKRDRIIAVTAGLSTLWVGMIFFISNLAEAEEAVLTATADARLTQLYTTLNLPLHTPFAAMYVVSLSLLLLVALKGQWPKAQKR